MNQANNTWADSWAASQQALMKAIFPVPAAGAAAADAAAGGVLQEHFAELRDTWQESIAQWTKLAEQGPQAAVMTPEALRALFAPARWSGGGSGIFDAALRQVLEGPKVATLFDLDRKLLELRQLASRRDKDLAAFQAIVQQGWNTAFQRFSSVTRTGDAESSVTWRSMADRWLAVVNDTFIEVHRTEAFIEAQRKMLRSASDYRLQERKIAEAWCEAFHIPTRTEMDEVQKTVIELRRQLRSLQRANLQPPAEPIEPPPRKRAPAKRRVAANI